MHVVFIRVIRARGRRPSFVDGILPKPVTASNYILKSVEKSSAFTLAFRSEQFLKSLEFICRQMYNNKDLISLQLTLKSGILILVGLKIVWHWICR